MIISTSQVPNYIVFGNNLKTIFVIFYVNVSDRFIKMASVKDTFTRVLNTTYSIHKYMCCNGMEHVYTKIARVNGIRLDLVPILLSATLRNQIFMI